ncbi:hypothetical protein [Xanthomonas hortorum]|uniref:Uncharacterized protein n=1 Tax=Xanthomonas hortorum TaxID=56454 RepID=A0AA47IC36_9XANT|nr:hypothetical protein [Xanthomonas hortorum]WAH65087.1 hypothetical protein OEG85_03630 [Xanthomonas hortorum]
MDDQVQAPTYAATIAMFRQHYVIPGLQLAVMHHKNRRPLNLKNEPHQSISRKRGTVMSETFEWINFPEGRARFSGGIRGFDELGHDTFAIEVDQAEVFGELEPRWLEDKAHFNIHILNFGYLDRIEVGMPLPSFSTRAFTLDELERVKLLVNKLIAAGLQFEDRPSALMESKKSFFTGQVVFEQDWALITQVDL